MTNKATPAFDINRELDRLESSVETAGRRRAIIVTPEGQGYVILSTTLDSAYGDFGWFGTEAEAMRVLRGLPDGAGPEGVMAEFRRGKQAPSLRLECVVGLSAEEAELLARELQRLAPEDLPPGEEDYVELARKLQHVMEPDTPPYRETRVTFEDVVNGEPDPVARLKCVLDPNFQGDWTLREARTHGETFVSSREALAVLEALDRLENDPRYGLALASLHQVLRVIYPADA